MKVDSSAKAVRGKMVDWEAMTKANDSYSKLTFVHEAVLCTVYGVFGARYVLETIWLACDLGTSIRCYGLEWYF